MNKKLQFLIWLTLSWAFLVLVYITYLLVYPFKTIEVLNEPSPTTSSQYHRGDDFSTTIHYIKYREADITTDRQIECEDGNLITLTATTRHFPLGENVIVTNHLVIPNKVSDGNCKLVYLAEYKINFLRTILHRFETETFEILPR